MNTKPVALLSLLLASSAYAADTTRFVSKVKLPSGQTAVVAEGDFEARSTGSFSVRLYDAAEPTDETTFFAAGTVAARDGTIDKVLVEDIDSDKTPELIVTVRSAGSGGYLSAHAFGVGKQELALKNSVEGLAPTADMVAELRKAKALK